MVHRGENPVALLFASWGAIAVPNSNICCSSESFLEYFLIELVFLASLLALTALIRTATLPNPMAVKEKVAGGLLAVLQWDMAAARAVPIRSREDNAARASSS